MHQHSSHSVHSLHGKGTNNCIACRFASVVQLQMPIPCSPGPAAWWRWMHSSSLDACGNPQATPMVTSPAAYPARCTKHRAHRCYPSTRIGRGTTRTLDFAWVSFSLSKSHLEVPYRERKKEHHCCSYPGYYKYMDGIKTNK